MFDAIEEVARATNRYYYEILLMMGFESDAELLAYCTQNTEPHFNKSVFIARELNEICKKLDAPLRVIRPAGRIGRKENK